MSKNYKIAIVRGVCNNHLWLNKVKDREVCIKNIFTKMIEATKLEFPSLGKKNNFIITIEIQNKDGANE